MVIVGLRRRAICRGVVEMQGAAEQKWFEGYREGCKSMKNNETFFNLVY